MPKLETSSNVCADMQLCISAPHALHPPTLFAVKRRKLITDALERQTLKWQSYIAAGGPAGHRGQKGKHLEEELDGGGVEFKGDGLQQVDEVAEDFIILKIEAHGHDLVDHVVGEKVEDGCGGADVLDEDGQRLQHLLGDIPPSIALVLQELGEMMDQVVLCKVVEVAGVVLVPPAATRLTKHPCEALYSKRSLEGSSFHALLHNGFAGIHRTISSAPQWI